MLTKASQYAHLSCTCLTSFDVQRTKDSRLTRKVGERTGQSEGTAGHTSGYHREMSICIPLTTGMRFDADYYPTERTIRDAKVLHHFMSIKSSRCHPIQKNTATQLHKQRVECLRKPQVRLDFVGQIRQLCISLLLCTLT